MKQVVKQLKDGLITLLILALAFFVSLLVHSFFSTDTSITAIFVLAVFLVSISTSGYLYGVAATLISVFAVNYAFTFPFFRFNFTIPENIVSAVIMSVVAFLTSTLTTKVKRQELIKAESEKERMRANLLRAVSHDLRTPLTTIYGSSSALLENPGGFTPAQETRMLQSIQEDADWLMCMVENLLSITRLDSGKVKLIKTPTALDELVDAALVKFHKRYPAQAVRLDLPEELIIIPMDALLIQQVLVNILENAVQHARGMTELSLKVFQLAQKAIFEIADDGCGVDEVWLKGVFSGDYAAAGNPSDGRKSSAGIGLSVCATIVRAHDGDIKAENRKGGGTVFRFSLNLGDTVYEQ